MTIRESKIKSCRDEHHATYSVLPFFGFACDRLLCCGSACRNYLRRSALYQKRASSSEAMTSKKRKSDIKDGCIGSKQEKEEALRCFAEWKMTKTGAKREQVEYICSLLRQGNLLDRFHSRIEPAMPEIYCFLSEIMKEMNETNFW